jgi:hypothetical protein
MSALPNFACSDWQTNSDRGASSSSPAFHGRLTVMPAAIDARIDLMKKHQ